MLTGKIVDMRGGRVVLSVGGVGYIVAVRSTLDFTLNSEATLHTHLAVRENALDLYGFTQAEELRMFEELITIPKIGPKTAMQILMQADATTLKQAILTQDPVYLTKMSGIGKKTAEKIVNELKDTFDVPNASHSTSPDSDLVDTLIALGYTVKDVRDALAAIPKKTDDPKKMITDALRYLGGAR